MHENETTRWLNKNAMGRGAITELERIALSLEDESPHDAQLVWRAVKVLKHLRRAVHGGPIEPPSKHWNKNVPWCRDCGKDFLSGAEARRHVHALNHDLYDGES